MRALAALDAAPFALVFGGGTALAWAHKLMQRMSEDVDGKIVPLSLTPLSRAVLQRQLALLHAACWVTGRRRSCSEPQEQ